MSGERSRGGPHGQSVLHDALAAADDIDLIAPFAVAEAIRDDQGRIVDFRMVAVNRRGAQVLRRDVSDVIGHTWTELWPGLVETDVFTAVVEVVETGVTFATGGAGGLTRFSESGEPVAMQSQIGRFRDGYVCTWVDVSDQFRISQRLSQAEDRYQRLLATAQEGIWIIDDNGVTTMLNDACARMLGLDPAEVVGKPAGEYVRPLLDATRLAFIEDRLEKRSRSGAHYEFNWPRPDGTTVQVWVSSTPLYRPDGTFEASIALVTDITAQRDAELHYRLLAENSTDVIRICDPDDVVTYISPAAEAVLGFTPAEMVGRRWQEFLDPEDAVTYRGVLEDLGHYPETFISQARFTRSDGTTIWLESAIRQIRDPETGDIVELQGSSRDVTQRVRAMQALEDAEERSRHRAVHDALTSLPNRRLLFDRLSHALAVSLRTHMLVAVLFVDIDNFKYINDSLGHDVGDQLLIEVGQRIIAAARTGDTVARFGGDEYVIVCEGIAAESAAINVAERVAALMQESLQVGGHRLRITVSIGIALSGLGCSRPGELLRNADLAMYSAKQRGRNRWEVFDASLSASAVRRVRVETEMRDALDAGQLRVHYQPIADLRTGRIGGVEALVRWEHPTRGLLLPAEFLDIAEETGLIVAIGAQVLHTACTDIAGWLWERPDKPLTVAVNVSLRQLAVGDFTTVLDQALAQSSLDPRLLHLELTETALFDATRTSPTDLAAIDALGVVIGIDDFGTGYSSLAYIKRFPVRFLKVDKSFVDGLALDPEDTAIVEAVVNLGQTLGLDVIAEGVETTLQLTRLRELGCTAAQGYLLAAPAPFHELSDILAADIDPSSWIPKSNGHFPSG
ncbi:MAG TPA: EAL domain-containing protein [Euzebya sp.]|nr:EAL domain-containing protein [Euzebya sp.]